MQLLTVHSAVLVGAGLQLDAEVLSFSCRVIKNLSTVKSKVKDKQNFLIQWFLNPGVPKPFLSGPFEDTGTLEGCYFFVFN